MHAIDMSEAELYAWRQERGMEPPNRFDHAIAVLKRFMQRRENDRIGMVIFARDAYLQFPLTLDYATIVSILDSLHLDMIDASATAIGNAIGVSVRGLMDSEARSRAIILITDGKQQGGNISPEQAAEPVARPTPVAQVVHIAERVTIMDLRDGMCRWPIGDPTSSEFRFCGASAYTGVPYCEYHSQLAYQPSADRRREK
jgi:hypothetical protein